MIEHLQTLIHALREELQQYGEMLALLDRQQELVVARAAEDLFQTISTIQNQATILQRARAVREEHRQTVAVALVQPADTVFTVLIPLLPADYQPLVQALVQENNQLLFRVQQRAHQNHLLLSRSLELMKRFMSTLFPSRETQVYNDQGNRQIFTLPARPLYDAVG